MSVQNYGDHHNYHSDDHDGGFDDGDYGKIGARCRLILAMVIEQLRRNNDDQNQNQNQNWRNDQNQNQNQNQGLGRSTSRVFFRPISKSSLFRTLISSQMGFR